MEEVAGLVVVDAEGEEAGFVDMDVDVVDDGLVCRSTWPRSRVGSMMLRTSCLRCLTSEGLN